MGGNHGLWLDSSLGGTPQLTYCFFPVRTPGGRSECRVFVERPKSDVLGNQRIMVWKPHRRLDLGQSSNATVSGSE